MSKRANVIVADPPWPFGDKLPGPGRGAEKHYKVMTIDEIKSFTKDHLDGLVEDDAMLVLWRVGSQQQEALDVAAAWGFVVKSEIVWVKTKPGTPDVESEESLEDEKSKKIGMGHYVRNEHEIALVCTRGKFKVADRGVRSTFRAPIGEHSEKPAKFFELIERLAGAEREGHLLELFARKPRPGWHVMGDEIPTGYAWTPRGGNTSIEVSGAPAAPSTNTLPEGWAKASAWDMAKMRAHAYDPEEDSRPDADEEAEEAIARSMVKAPKTGRACSFCKEAGHTARSCPKKKASAPDGKPMPKDARGSDTGAPAAAEGRKPAEGPGTLLGQVTPPPHTNGTNGSVKYSLSDETARALYVERAVKDKLLSKEEARNTAEGWILLQSRAPSEWFDAGPFNDARPTVAEGEAKRADEGPGLSRMAQEMDEAGAPISLLDLAQLAPFKRDVLRAWLDNEGGNLDRLPDWFVVRGDAAEPSGWEIARGALAQWEASGSPDEAQP